MSASVIGSLRVNLGLDSAQFERGAKRVNAPLARMRSQFKAVAGVAAIAFGAISAAALAGANKIDEVAKSARRLDSSIGGFLALELAAGEAGVSLSGLTNDIQTMNRELSSIGTSGNGARALTALGLSIDDLEGKDADEKLAIIADQVKALGLDAGQTTAILRDLGVRNREMALLVLGGGDAIRQARTDVEAYGLAISDVDANRIEAANDAIGRLGLITQYAGQQLAIALVPAMGALAQKMTDSLREGGLLRTVIDGLTGSIDVIIASMGVAVAVFGVRYVAAMAAARGATGLFSGSLIVLRGALLATGIGAVIVAAGFLITKFTELVTKVGGVGNAFGLLKDVAVEAFGRIGTAFSIIPAAVQAGAIQMAYFFSQKLYQMAFDFALFTQDIAEGLNNVFGTSLSGLSTSGLYESGLGQAMRGLGEDAAVASANVASIGADLMAPLASMGALRAAMAGANDEISAGADTANELAEALEGVDDAAGGGGGAGGDGGATGSIAAVGEAARTAQERMAEMWENSGLKSFVDDISQGLSQVSSLKDAIGVLKDAAINAFQKMAESLLNSGLTTLGQSLLGGLGGGGGILGSIGGALGFGGGGLKSFASAPSYSVPKSGAMGGYGKTYAMAQQSNIAPAQASMGGGTIVLDVRSDPSVIVKIAQNTTGAVVKANNEQRDAAMQGKVNTLIDSSDYRRR